MGRHLVDILVQVGQVRVDWLAASGIPALLTRPACSAPRQSRLKAAEYDGTAAGRGCWQVAGIGNRWRVAQCVDGPTFRLAGACILS